MDDLKRLAELLRERNRVEAEIAAVIGRPAQAGHLGEFIASGIFEIKLEKSAATRGIDGRFESGPLAGCSVNVKFYPRHTGILDVQMEGGPDYYLVLAGPWSPAVASRGQAGPWAIASAYLFDASQLLAELQARGVRIGVATSVVRALWDRAEIYPAQRSTTLPLSLRQHALLSLFRVDTPVGGQMEPYLR